MGYKDPVARAAYQRKWLADRRNEYFAGKSCVGCGSESELELDHVDRSTKISHRIWGWPQVRREAELLKCQVLCRSCHEAKSRSEMKMNWEHGDFRQYKHGKCRCTLCRRGWAARQRKYRLARPTEAAVDATSAS